MITYKTIEKLPAPADLYLSADLAERLMKQPNEAHILTPHDIILIASRSHGLDAEFTREDLAFVRERAWIAIQYQAQLEAAD